ncbi:MAG: hypothetical protein K9L17_04915 [Clostridiales bacterium]|nr:hypothetical protein [Clostridiales bacterium]
MTKNKYLYSEPGDNNAAEHKKISFIEEPPYLHEKITEVKKLVPGTNFLLTNVE